VKKESHVINGQAIALFLNMACLLIMYPEQLMADGIFMVKHMVCPLANP
jgi:hypothetical protein